MTPPHCAHVCGAPLVLIEGRWFHAHGAPVHDAEPGDDPRALLRAAEARLEAAAARLAGAERLSAARLEELLRVEAKAEALRALIRDELWPRYAEMFAHSGLGEPADSVVWQMIQEATDG
jgi:hypothetical protein